MGGMITGLNRALRRSPAKSMQKLLIVMGDFKYKTRQVADTARFALIGSGQACTSATLTLDRFCPASSLGEALRSDCG